MNAWEHSTLHAALLALLSAYLMIGCAEGERPSTYQDFLSAVDAGAECPELYDIRNAARRNQPSRSDDMNVKLREIGCFSSTSTRRTEPQQTELPPLEGPATVATICDRYVEALMISAGPPPLSDAETAELYEDLADEARGTELEQPIREVARLWRTGQPVYDQQVRDICD